MQTTPAYSVPVNTEQAVQHNGHEAEATDPAREPGMDRQEQEQQQEYRTLLRKFWFAAIVSLPVIGLSYPDMLPGLRDWMLMGSLERCIVWGILGLLTLPVILWSGSQFYGGGFILLANAWNVLYQAQGRSPISPGRVLCVCAYIEPLKPLSAMNHVIAYSKVGFLWLALLVLPVAVQAAGSAKEAEPPLGTTVQGLLAWAEQHNPELTAMRYETEAAEARVQPAGALPDPMFRVEWQDLSRSNSSLVPGPAESIKYTLAQTLPCLCCVAERFDGKVFIQS